MLINARSSSQLAVPKADLCFDQKFLFYFDSLRWIWTATMKESVVSGGKQISMTAV